MLQRVAVWGSCLALVAVVLACPTRGAAQEGVTVQGEIVDLACYMAKGSKGPAHQPCAQMCAKKGFPIGLLTDNQGLFLLLADDRDPTSYEAAKKLAGEHVEISGKKFSKEGIASLVVGSVKQAGPAAAADGSQVMAVNEAR